ncbi:ABC-type nitrate/sulfonate/bicarbonate transport system substrate-binding protein [Rhodococcus sp. LBL1]|nr:ABC-type nitrate/sulfonate/bicarbonate transport system substrate-binding protein [Rhodococcus sp. LBL1]MDH6681110.1 ABC-type nitrate/sulfonate/bicarbonate transport system substrate-binding protein [Rhodococcus sp. LBL2]
MKVRTLVDTVGLFRHPSLWFVRREFAENHRGEPEAIVAALQESDAWIVADPREAARFFVEDAERNGGTADLDRWEEAMHGRPFGIGAVTDGRPVATHRYPGDRASAEVAAQMSSRDGVDG